MVPIPLLPSSSPALAMSCRFSTTPISSSTCRMLTSSRPSSPTSPRVSRPSRPPRSLRVPWFVAREQSRTSSQVGSHALLPRYLIHLIPFMHFFPGRQSRTSSQVGSHAPVSRKALSSSFFHLSLMPRRFVALHSTTELRSPLLKDVFCAPFCPFAFHVIVPLSSMSHQLFSFISPLLPCYNAIE